MVSLLTVAALLAACPPPGGGGTPPPETYTTTVSGKVITPARAADPAKGSTITTARVWASTDPTKKIAVGADGSYSLQVAGHSGNFTITAEYTAAGDKNYKTGDPRTVTTKGAAIENQDIALEYGYTTTVRGTVVTLAGGGTTAPVVGATVVIEVEGIEAGRDTARAGNGEYRITVDHPGVMTAKVTSSTGNVTRNLTTADTELIRIFNL